MSADIEVMKSSVGTTYRHRTLGYSVTVDTRGAILVKSGDWLSKYSAAINDTFWQWEDYCRFDGERVTFLTEADPNKLVAGETIFHVPTLKDHVPSGTPHPIINAPRPIDPDDEEKITRSVKAIQAELDLPADNLPWLRKLCRAWGPANFAGAIATSVAEMTVGGFIVGGAAFALTTVLAIGAPLALAAGGVVSALDGKEEGAKLFGMKAMVYSLTSLAFDGPGRAPMSPPGSRMRSIREHHANSAETYVKLYEKAWIEGWNGARDKLAGNLPNGMSIESYRLMLRALGEGKPKILSRKLWTKMEQDGFFKFASSPTILRGYATAIEYPN